MIEVKGSGAERLGALVAQLVAIDDDGPHAEDPTVRAQQLSREIRRLALAERREDVDREVQGAEQLPAAAVAHRHAVLQRQESIVGLQWQAEVRLDPDEGQHEPAAAPDDENVVRVGI